MNQESTKDRDQIALQSLQNGSWNAFEAIYETYWSKLYLSAYGILRDKHACEDIVQDVFVQLWLKRHSAQIESLAAYLHTSVRYQVFKAAKAGKVKVALPEEIVVTTLRSEAEDALLTEDLIKILDCHIERLPEKCREVFLLSRKKHLSIQEISAQLQISSKTVENHLTTALKRLRYSLGDFLFWACVTIPAYLS